MKTRINIILDDFLDEANFYELRDEFEPSGATKWTTQRRIDFIKRNYKLGKFFSIINDQIKKYEISRSAFIPILKKEITIIRPIPMIPKRIELLTLLILIWSQVMTRGKKIDWINMEQLIAWFKIRIKNSKMLDLSHLEKSM